MKVLLYAVFNDLIAPRFAASGLMYESVHFARSAPRGTLRSTTISLKTLADNEAYDLEDPSIPQS
jgi:hypothetical protein